MKKLSLLIIVAFTSSTLLFAQQDSLKAYEGNWGITLNLTGVIQNMALSSPQNVINQNSLLVKHFLKDDIALRIGFGLHTISDKYTSADSIGNMLVEVDSTYKRNDLSFSIGIEKHLGQAKHLDPYLGGELAFGFIGRMKSDATTKSSDASGTSTLQRIRQQDGGNAVSVNLLAGFNYFFSDKLSIGAETSLGYAYTSTGGNYSLSVVDSPASGTGNSTFDKGKMKQNNAGFRVHTGAALLLSFFF